MTKYEQGTSFRHEGPTQNETAAPADDSVTAQLEGLGEALGYHRELLGELRGCVSTILRSHPVPNPVVPPGSPPATCPCDLSSRIADTRAGVIVMNNDLRQLIEAIGL